MSRTSTRGCISRKGTPLRAYPDQRSGDAAAERATRRFGERMLAYCCQRCRSWHLCPARRQTPSHDCDYCDKRSYETEGGAERRAAIIEAERGKPLRVYECPYGDGWHLTSSVW
ncbi:MAG: hypothetical protein H6741_24380 [Alphaproteobacteria bacterium]|nr:hypothetical protein [Alphaproteobacteria bacterium]MCB9795846.1 hypothetical protein [Alphaproteobacteria bacterium]